MVERCGFWAQSPAGFLTTFMKVVSNPRSGYNGQTEWIRLDVAWMAYLVLITRK
jgi:hypothetical protein